jgi:membrane-bound inhibitor of C-type lysozyme
MKTLVPLFLVATLAAAGCATTATPAPEPPPATPSTPATKAPAPAPAPAAPASDERAFAFSCDDGQRIQVRFSRSRNLATLVRAGESIELPQQASGSGFIYSNGRTTLRGKGEELMLEVGRMAPVRCREG